MRTVKLTSAFEMFRSMALQFASAARYSSVTSSTVRPGLRLLQTQVEIVLRQGIVKQKIGWQSCKFRISKRSSIYKKTYDLRSAWMRALKALRLHSNSSRLAEASMRGQKRSAVVVASWRGIFVDARFWRIQREHVVTSSSAQVFSSSRV